MRNIKTTEVRGGATKPRLLLKACPRCHGDLVLEADLFDRETPTEYACIQCGRRHYPVQAGEREAVKVA